MYITSRRIVCYSYIVLLRISYLKWLSSGNSANWLLNLLLYAHLADSPSMFYTIEHTGRISYRIYSLHFDGTLPLWMGFGNFGSCSSDRYEEVLPIRENIVLSLSPLWKKWFTCITLSNILAVFWKKP